MSRENYTRRPRKWFEVRRANFDRQSIRTSSRLDRDSYGIYSGNWKGSSENETLRRVKKYLLLSAVLVLLYVLVIEPIRLRIRKQNFEADHFVKMYGANRKSFDNLIALSQSLTMAHIFKLTKYGGLFIVIRSPDFTYKGVHQAGENVVNLTGSWSKEYKEFHIEGETMFVNQKGRKYYVLNDWAIIYDGNIDDTVTVNKVLPLVKLNRTTVSEALTDFEKTNIEEFYLDEKKVLHLKLKNYEYGNYEIVTSSIPLRLGKNINSGVVKQNIFWLENRVGRD